MDCEFLIVTPLLNGRRFLADCVESVREAFRGYDYRHVFVDAGSSDEPLELIRQCGDTRVSFIEVKGCSIYQALNVGMTDVNFRVFYQLNVDDIVLRGAVRDVEQVLDGLRSPAVIVGGCISVYTAERRFRMRYPLESQGILNALSAGIYLPQPSAFITREIFKRVGGFSDNLRFAGDTEFWIRVSEMVPGAFRFRRGIFSLDRISGDNARFLSRHQLEIADLLAAKPVGKYRRMHRRAVYAFHNVRMHCSVAGYADEDLHCAWKTWQGGFAFFFSQIRAELEIYHPALSGVYTNLGRL